MQRTDDQGRTWHVPTESERWYADKAIMKFREWAWTNDLPPLHDAGAGLTPFRMDLMLTAGSIPLDFQALASADLTTLVHDMSGIFAKLDRDTGKLIDPHWTPRCTLQQEHTT